jgi:hypothetical protein
MSKLIISLTICVCLIGSYTTVVGAQNVGIVVSYSGTDIPVCVPLTGTPPFSAYELLARSHIPFTSYRDAQYGYAVCSMYGKGCCVETPCNSSSCFCKSDFWNFAIQQNGQWVLSSQGVSSTGVSPGQVIGFAWGPYPTLPRGGWTISRICHEGAAASYPSPALSHASTYDHSMMENDQEDISTPFVLGSMNYAGVVVAPHTPGNPAQAVCVSWPSTLEVTAYDVLQLSQFQYTSYTDPKYGIALCSMRGVGCCVTTPCNNVTCFCQPPNYWGFFLLNSTGQWSLSNVGVSSYNVSAGGVIGFGWGNTSSPGAHWSFDRICPGRPFTSKPVPVVSHTPSHAHISLPTVVHSSDPSFQPASILRAALVVQIRLAAVSICIPLTTPNVTGLELLRRSNLGVVADSGGAVCAINNLGCLSSAHCFCACPIQGPNCIFWNYWHAKNNQWEFSQVGAAQWIVKPGSADGWAWGVNGTQPIWSDYPSICN